MNLHVKKDLWSYSGYLYKTRFPYQSKQSAMGFIRYSTGQLLPLLSQLLFTPLQMVPIGDYRGIVALCAALATPRTRPPLPIVERITTISHHFSVNSVTLPTQRFVRYLITTSYSIWHDLGKEKSHNLDTLCVFTTFVLLVLTSVNGMQKMAYRFFDSTLTWVHN